jgi:hypothetical protein
MYVYIYSDLLANLRTRAVLERYQSGAGHSCSARHHRALQHCTVYVVVSTHCQARLNRTWHLWLSLLCYQILLLQQRVLGQHSCWCQLCCLCLHHATAVAATVRDVTAAAMSWTHQIQTVPAVYTLLICSMHSISCMGTASQAEYAACLITVYATLNQCSSAARRRQC